jgi:DNA ligase-associated metallophosphoesterase
MPNTLHFALSTGKEEIPLQLFADRAMYWPGGQTLFITDPHFGKADAFHHVGIAIPSSVLDHDLARLSHLLHESQAEHLVILGDFFHTRHSQSDAALASLAQWRNNHAALAITLVQGNHDLHAGPPPQSFDIVSTTAPYLIGPFACHHHPQLQPSDHGYVLAGHLHPQITMRDRDGSALRLASFIFGRHQAILPAYGNFTGGSAYAPSPGDRVFAFAQGEIVEIPTTPSTNTAGRRVSRR